MFTNEELEEANLSDQIEADKLNDLFNEIFGKMAAEEKAKRDRQAIADSNTETRRHDDIKPD